MSLATARPASSGYRHGYAVVSFPGRPPAPHPVLVRADGAMVPVTHTRRGWRPVPLPAGWADDGDTRVAFAKPEFGGRWPLTRRSRREGLRPLRRDLWALADAAFALARI